MPEDVFSELEEAPAKGDVFDEIEATPQKVAPPIAPTLESPLAIGPQGPIYKGQAEAERYGTLSPSDLTFGQRLRRTEPVERLLGPTPEEIEGMGGSAGARVGALPVLTSTIPLLPVGIGGMAGKALMTYFAADLARQQPEIYRQAKAAAERGDWSEFGKVVGEDAFASALTALGMRQVFTPGGTGRPVVNLETMKRAQVPGLKLPAPEPLRPPTVTETTPPVPKSEMPTTPSVTGLLPGVRKVGGETVVGEAGQTHPEIMRENQIPREEVDQRVMVDQATGAVLDREQAAAATPELPTTTEPGRRHSTDLPEAKADKVTLYSGGEGSSWFTTNPERAKSMAAGGPVFTVELTPEEFAEAAQRAKEGGSGTAGDALLTNDQVKRAQEVGRRTVPKVWGMDEPVAPKQPSALDQLRQQAARVLVETRNFNPEDAAAYATKLGGEKELAGFLADNTPEALAALEKEAAPAPPAAAPAAPAETPAAVAEKVERELQPGRITTEEVPRSNKGAKQARTILIRELEKIAKESPQEADIPEGKPTEKVTIDIPGDGEFTVFKTKENLEYLLKRAKGIKTTPPKGFREKTPGEGIAPDVWVQSSEATHSVTTRSGKETFQKKGKPIEIGGKKLWLTSEGMEFSITEPVTGLRIGAAAPTIDKAIRNAEERLSSPEAQKNFDARMREEVKKHGKLPEPTPLTREQQAVPLVQPEPKATLAEIKKRLAAGEKPGAEAGGGQLHQMIYDFGKSIYQKGMDFAAWSTRMVKELGESAKAWLQSVWTRITDLGDFDVRTTADQPAPFIPIRIQDAAGNVYDAQFNGYWDFRKGGMGLKPSVGRQMPNGRWSHGLLKPDEKILTRLPSFEKWAKLEAAEKARAATPIALERQAGAGITPLGDLTSKLRNSPISPDRPFAERLKAALDIAGRWARGKDVVTQGMAGARAASFELWNRYYHQPPWKDFESAVGQWTGADQRTSREVRKFLKAINRTVPNKLRQEAITNWIQADGDAATLRHRAANTRPAFRAGYEMALRLSPDEIRLARDISTYLDAKLNDGIAAGLLQQGVDNYVTQIWKRPNVATNRMFSDLFGTGNLNPSFRFARKRIFENYFEGEQAGYTPRTKTIGNLISAYDMAFNRSMSARGLIKALHDGVAADGQPIAMISGTGAPVPKGQPVPDAFLIKPHTRPKGAIAADGRPYQKVDHWALRGWKWASKTETGEPIFVQGDMLVHPDYATKLRRALATSPLRQIPFTRGMLRATMFAKQTKLSLSPFHTVQEGLHAMAHKVDPTGLIKRMADIDLSQPEQEALVNHGLMVSDTHAAELFSEGLTGGGLVKLIPGLGQLQQWYTEKTFQDYIPRLKMTMALDALKRNRKVYAKDVLRGKITDDQIIALTARQSNAAFGEQNYRVMGRSPFLQDVLRIGFLAPDFLEARARFIGQALKPYGHEQRIALALMAGALYVISRIMNKALDDDEHWDKPFSIVHQGREYHLRTLLGDVEHLRNDWRGFWYNRFSPLTRTVFELGTSRDDRGIKRSSMEQFADFLKWFVPIPFQRRPGEGTPQAILASTGVPSRQLTAQQELYKTLDSWRSKQTDPKIKEAYDRQRQETHIQSPYGAMRTALIGGNMKEARKQYDALLKIRTPAQVEKAMRPWTGGNINVTTLAVTPRKPKPFTGSWKTEPAFVKSLSGEDLANYKKAQDERLKVYQTFRAMIAPPKPKDVFDEITQ